MGTSENHEQYTDKIQNLEEGASPEVTGEVEFSDEKEKLATWTQKDMKDVLPPGPTSSKPLESCDATVKGHSPRRQRAKPLLQQTTSSFVCPDCGKKFFSKSDVALHQWYHSRKQPYHHVSFAKPSQLAQHQYCQPEECQCSKCGKRFTDRCGLMRHQAIHSAKRPFHRHLRGFYFNYNLRQHQNPNQQPTTAKSLFQCPHCGRQFTRRCNLIQHSRIHEHLWQDQGKQEVFFYPGDQTQ